MHFSIDKNLIDKNEIKTEIITNLSICPSSQIISRFAIVIFDRFISTFHAIKLWHALWSWHVMSILFQNDRNFVPKIFLGDLSWGLITLSLPEFLYEKQHSIMRPLKNWNTRIKCSIMLLSMYLNVSSLYFLNNLFMFTIRRIIFINFCRLCNRF